ncbi:MAG: hypothetical protein J7M18_02495 [Candidatus Eremiobacteraeota bacterium]|nr:hypothetical protein [Candidatus Eremiobacteraeota bacterium]
MTKETGKEKIAGKIEKKADIPSRSVLMDELQQLAAVSARNEMLTRMLAEGKATPDDIKDEIETCIAEQSRIVNRFISLSDNKPVLEHFSTLMSKIDENIKSLGAAEEPDLIENTQREVLDLVQKWSRNLEIIVKEVFEKAPEE